MINSEDISIQTSHNPRDKVYIAELIITARRKLSLDEALTPPDYLGYYNDIIKGLKTKIIEHIYGDLLVDMSNIRSKINDNKDIQRVDLWDIDKMFDNLFQKMYNCLDIEESTWK
jgi:hypothetical protein